MGLPLKGMDQSPNRVTAQVWAGLQPGPFILRAARVTTRAQGYLEGSQLLSHTLSQVRTREQESSVGCRSGALGWGGSKRPAEGKRVTALTKLDASRDCVAAGLDVTATRSRQPLLWGRNLVDMVVRMLVERASSCGCNKLGEDL